MMIIRSCEEAHSRKNVQLTEEAKSWEVGDETWRTQSTVQFFGQDTCRILRGKARSLICILVEERKSKEM